MRVRLEPEGGGSEVVRGGDDRPAGLSRVVAGFTLGHSNSFKDAVRIGGERPRPHNGFPPIGSRQRAINLGQANDVLYVARDAAPKEIRRAVPRPLKEGARHESCAARLCCTRGCMRGNSTY
jgi:hypothetical protein